MKNNDRDLGKGQTSKSTGSTQNKTGLKQSESLKKSGTVANKDLGTKRDERSGSRDEDRQDRGTHKGW